MRASSRASIVVLLWLLMPAAAQAQSASVAAESAKGANAHIQTNWWISASAIHRVTLKPETRYWRFEHLFLKPQEAELQLHRWRDEGISAIEIFAPAEGGNSYDGLDAINRFRLDPGVGTVDDFRRLVRQAHQAGLKVIIFDNLGYSSIYAPQFQKACEDVRAGRPTAEAHMFLWSDRADASPPARGNSYFLIRPNFPNYNSEKSEFWQWDDQCRHFYWTKWPGKDAHGNPIRLPQYNWAGSEWPSEAGKVVRFWMNTGIDGMIVDAVNWYVGYTWEKGNGHITGIIASYGNKFSQPEGGGAFHSDDPVGWVTEGHWINLQDYGLGIWWEKGNNPLKSSIEDHDPDQLESALRGYHDRIVAAGGSLYVAVPHMQSVEEQQFVEALLAALGDLVCYCDPLGGVTSPAPGISRLLKVKSRFPALYQNSDRRRIPTNDDHKFYAFVRVSADHSQRILAVFNFQPEAARIEVDTAAMDAKSFTSLLKGQAAPANAGALTVQLPRFGYELLLVH